MAEEKKLASGGNDTANSKIEADEYEIVDKPIETGDDDDEGSDKPLRADDHDDDEGDQRLSSESEAEHEERRSKRREQREKQKGRRKAAIDRDRELIARYEENARQMADRIAQLEAGSLNAQVQTIEAKMADIARSYQNLEARKAEAVRLGDGDALVRIDREIQNASAQWHELNNRKGSIAPSPDKQMEAQRPVAPKVTERGRIFAEDFLAEHKWINLEGTDRESRLVRQIDLELSGEKLDPNTRSYWEEFEERLRDQFPDRFRKNKERSSPPIGSGREHVPNSTRKQVYISAGRRKAMEDAGVWDDPKKRNEYIKEYANYDRNNASR
ncbi:hypothetical protein UFOVP1204_7 [uncultured Caudovirales phage]|uniref:Uncharacterized protein n=1 Tax=uncultured Caudovirales phage TaxID=2100421 RepID=A0A6J5MJG0_9CAUD|nr:hypothetical protein UFOVP473_20 [uncultured Caudovirales phage]CAB4176363.1 hypothetical protein UFOVP983_20 [uncultured Caudovirales phage]CAB4189481.1 hypothetical protein UFOVP1204_7 [uncultured Caudovirales phage]